MKSIDLREQVKSHRTRTNKARVFARHLRTKATPATKCFWQIVRDRRFAGFKFRREYPCGQYFLDFYCVRARLAIEVDGGVHGFPDQRARDKKRNDFLTSKGIKVLRFWNHQLRNECETVRFEIWYALMERTGRKNEIAGFKVAPAPSPLPSPPMGARETESSPTVYTGTSASGPLNFSPIVAERAKEKGRAVSSRTRGFTLIELVLVMALLVIVVSLIMPSLRGFFEGRTLDAEVRRFVSLTHYAQSRAVSEGEPMLLWVDPKAGTYGLQDESGYTDSDSKAVDYTIGEGLKINLDNGKAKVLKTSKRTGIHFSPDGNAIASTSVAGVSIQEDSKKPVWIVPAGNGLSYEAKY